MAWPGRTDSFSAAERASTAVGTYSIDPAVRVQLEVPSDPQFGVTADRFGAPRVDRIEVEDELQLRTEVLTREGLVAARHRFEAEAEIRRRAAAGRASEASTAALPLASVFSPNPFAVQRASKSCLPTPTHGVDRLLPPPRDPFAGLRADDEIGVRLPVDTGRDARDATVPCMRA